MAWSIGKVRQPMIPSPTVIRSLRTTPKLATAKLERTTRDKRKSRRTKSNNKTNNIKTTERKSALTQVLRNPLFHLALLNNNKFLTTWWYFSQCRPCSYGKSMAKVLVPMKVCFFFLGQWKVVKWYCHCAFCIELRSCKCLKLWERMGRRAGDACQARAHCLSCIVSSFLSVIGFHRKWAYCIIGFFPCSWDNYVILSTKWIGVRDHSS